MCTGCLITLGVKCIYGGPFPANLEKLNCIFFSRKMQALVTDKLQTPFVGVQGSIPGYFVYY